MKKILALSAILILLTACSATEPISARGEVVDCSSISVQGGVSQKLECLGGGSPIAPDGIKGPALINVWGTWCTQCRKELPHLIHFQQKSNGAVQLIGIAVEEKSQESVREHVVKKGITWPILYDKNDSTRAQFGMGVPVTWFIDKDGKPVYKKYGPFKSLEEIQLLVKKYLGDA
jgi:cytochrome c biogenesis protein CcmG/thiol:disulfide interchange protein DsbE